MSSLGSAIAAGADKKQKADRYSKADVIFVEFCAECADLHQSGLRILVHHG